MSLTSTLGLTIPNSNYAFSCTKAKCISDYLFIFTKEHELIVYLKQEDKINNVSLLKKKYILLTQMQNREGMVDVFIMDSSRLILSPTNKVILTISKRCIIHYFNLIDGLCIHKLNLSSFMEHNDEIVQISEINKRFLIIVFRRKAIVYDSFANVVIKEEEMKVLKPSRELLEIGQDQKKEISPAPNDSSNYYQQQQQKKRENKPKQKEEYETFEIDKIYQVKDNSFFIKCKEENTFFLQVTNLKELDKKSLDYEEARIKIIKQTFKIDKFITNDSFYSMFSNQDYLFHNMSQVIKLSFLDSVEELTEVTDYKTKAKYPIKFVSSIVISGEEYLLVLYGDFKCDLLTYDKKLREIKKHKEFVVMVDDKLFNMQFVTSENALIGYNEFNINLFDLRRYVKTNEKYVDKEIHLKDIFNRDGSNLFFTNYFSRNFPAYINEITSQLSSITSEGFCGYSITTSVIFAYCENKSIYYIFGTDAGKVGILDVFFTENLNLNPILIVDYHQAPIETLSIYDNRTLITSSKDGMISFTDISLQKLEAIINKTTIEKREYIDDLNLSNLKKNHSKIRKDTIDYYTQLFNYSYIRRKTMESHIRQSSQVESGVDTEEKLNTVTLIPSHNIKNFYRLKRIMPVVKLDQNSVFSNEEEKKKSNSLLALDLENNDVIVIRMDNFTSLYRFNQGTSSISIKAIYHLSYQKSFVFYLDNNTVKIGSYSTRTCDRYITDMEKIYKILRAEEKLSLYFLNQSQVNAFVSHISKQSLCFDELQAEKNKAKTKDRERGLLSRRELFNQITLQNIKEAITDPLEREIFTLKLWENSYLNRQSLSMTPNKFEAIWMKKIEHWVIDEIISIINHPEQNEQLKKVQIMNLLFNPETFLKVEDMYDSMSNGISVNYLRIGQQYNEFLLINNEDYFTYLEKKISEQKDVKGFFRTNYFNFLSLFHIWNFELKSDIFLYEHFKIFQPIFDFFPILIGYDSACSLILIEEEKIDPILNASPFDQHFYHVKQGLNSKMTMNNVKETNSSTQSSSISNSNEQKSLFFKNKSILIESYQGYLVNLKNYQASPNLSHHLHLSLFGSLIALLGFEDNAQLCKFIEKDKNIMKILANKKHIEYSSFEMLNSFLFEANDNISLANKDLLLIDYLDMQHSIMANSKFDFGRRSAPKTVLDNIAAYLSKVYMYIFNTLTMNDSADSLYPDFHKLNNKDGKLDSIISLKSGYLTQYELSLITLLITYNNISSHNDETHKLPEYVLIKITELLILYVWKITKDSEIQVSYSKNVVELLSKSSETLEIIYKDSLSNYAKFLIEFYTVFTIPINFESLFKTYEIGTCPIIKSEENTNFLKIILAKLIKNYSKAKFSLMLKIIVDEFKKKSMTHQMSYFSFLIEIVWILFRERNSKHIPYLPTVINLIMNTLDPLNKDLKIVCLENSKKVLSRLIVNYPMIAFHQNSQKVAVGANDGKIFIYDMTSGSLWKNLPAHDNEISAISFDLTGNIIVSYSSSEHLVKCWKIGLTNFFSNFFSMKDGYYKQNKFPPVQGVVSPEEKLKLIKFQLVPNKEYGILLFRENKSVIELQI